MLSGSLRPLGLEEGSGGADGSTGAPCPHSLPHASLPPPGANSRLAATCGKGVHWGRHCPEVFTKGPWGKTPSLGLSVIVFRGGGGSLGGGNDASACRNSVPLPLDLGNERRGVKAAARLGWGADFIQNRL